MVRVTSRYGDAAVPTDVDTWLPRVAQGRSESDVDLLRRAARFAANAHTGQRRASGEPYVQHALAVAQILVELHLDVPTLAAAMLHDVVEDTAVTMADIERDFGAEVARLVDGVTKMKWIRPRPDGNEKGRKERAHVESLRKMLLAMAEDVRVVLIKLADRLHNMRTLGSLPEDKQKRIARETMDIYAPLANRLGIWQIKWELEDLSFRYLEPVAYKQIAGWLAERRADREEYVARVVALLRDELKKAGIEAEVTGRVKHIYGIWRKMRRKNLDFNQIFDVRALRVLTQEVRDCYAALGIVHTLWQYIPGEFDDYIATPKENEYRSIHTAVIGLEGKTVEVQIRTYEMHQQSELGVAAHWRYKEGTKSDADFDRKIAWLRQLLEWKEEVAEASDFVDQFKSEVFADRVYVFTPKGNIVDLPQGATPLDFAYHIHTEVGHRCRGAKVNGHIVPLTHRLKSGEQVEVLTVKKGGPSRDWLNPHLGYLTTSKARSKAQQWFKQENRESSIAAGRQTLERELHRLGFTDVNYERLAQHLHFAKVEDFLAGIGSGEVRGAQILGGLQDIADARAESRPTPVVPAKPRSAGSGALRVQGVGNLLTRMARCCKPLPGDPIVGYITRGAGVTVHRRDCPNVLRYNNDSRDRLVEVAWGTEAGRTYPVDVQIAAYDRQGLLRDISAVLANERINMIAVNTTVDATQNVARIGLTLEIPDIDTLSRVLAQIEQLPNVTEVRRRTH